MPDFAAYLRSVGQIAHWGPNDMTDQPQQPPSQQQPYQQPYPQPPYQQPQPPYQQPYQQRPPKPKMDIGKKILIGFGIFVLLGIVGVALGGGKDEKGKDADSAAPAASLSADATSAPKPAAAPPPAPITIADFRVDIQVIERKCFGSAGCLFEYTINPVLLRPAADYKGSYTVVYDVVGGDEVQTLNFALKGTTATFDKNERISVSSSDVVLQANVTSVIAR